MKYRFHLNLLRPKYKRLKKILSWLPIEKRLSLKFQVFRPADYITIVRRMNALASIVPGAETT